MQDFRSALTLKSPLISTVDIVMIMTSTLLLMCRILLWHFHVSSAFSVTFWTACNSSKSKVFRNKSFQAQQPKNVYKNISRNINQTRTVDPHCPRPQYLLTHLTTHFLPCDSIPGISLMIKPTFKYFSPLSKALIVLLTLPYISFSPFTLGNLQEGQPDDFLQFLTLNSTILF